MDTAKKIKQFVKKEHEKPTSKYGYEPYEFHLVPMVEYAENLARELGGDKEVVSLAAWLHDIGSIIYGRKDHHITGAEIAEKKLKEFNYSPQKTELVKKCILNHRGSQKNNRNTIEEKIIAEADAMSNFDNIPGIFKAAFIYENLDQGQAKIAVRKKLENKWKRLHFENSKKIIRPKFEAAMIILK
ncbi:metal-dependent phosphohydrolase [Candidatus Falkowbacteria bacterium]|nr:MAG: metal-dependent phosphohydrolase [Candidatus Falkowbacteria bacterium]